MEEVASQAITANILNTMNFLLQFSDVLRDRVRSGQLEIPGYQEYTFSVFLENLAARPVKIQPTPTIPSRTTTNTPRSKVQELNSQ